MIFPHSIRCSCWLFFFHFDSLFFHFVSSISSHFVNRKSFHNCNVTVNFVTSLETAKSHSYQAQTFNDTLIDTYTYKYIYLNIRFVVAFRNAFFLHSHPHYYYCCYDRNILDSTSSPVVDFLRWLFWIHILYVLTYEYSQKEAEKCSRSNNHYIHNIHILVYASIIESMLLCCECRVNGTFFHMILWEAERERKKDTEKNKKNPNWSQNEVASGMIWLDGLNVAAPSCSFASSLNIYEHICNSLFAFDSCFACGLCSFGCCVSPKWSKRQTNKNICIYMNHTDDADSGSANRMSMNSHGANSIKFIGRHRTVSS